MWPLKSNIKVPSPGLMSEPTRISLIKQRTGPGDPFVGDMGKEDKYIIYITNIYVGDVGEEDTYNDQDYWRILMITPVPNSTFGNIK